MRSAGKGRSRPLAPTLSRRRLVAVAALVVLLTPPPVCAQRSSSRRHAAKGRENAKKHQTSRLDVSRINDPNTKDPVGPHSEGEAVVRAGVLLDRLKFSPGEISSSYNDNLAKAIAAFQSVSGLPAVGSMDAQTWDALNKDQASGRVEPVQAAPGGNAPQGQPKPSQPNPSQPEKGQGQGSGNQQPAQPQTGTSGTQSAPPPALITYIVTMEDVLGRFTKLPRVSSGGGGEQLILKEAKLPRLNFTSPLDLLAEKFHSSPRLLIQLNPRKGFKRPGEQIQVPNVLTPTPPQADSVVVDASTHSVTALDHGGKVLAFYPATIGSEHDPLPVGNWKVVEVKWYPKFKYNPNLFWDSENKHAKATLPPGPRSPVGVVWIGLSKEHYGIHGTPTPAAIGKTQSHGCIRLTNWDASELPNMIRSGTPVMLQVGTSSAVKAQSGSSR